MKCLIIDEMHESIIPLLEQIDLNYEYLPDSTEADILKVIHEYEGVIVRSKMRMDEKFFSLAKKLKFIARAGAGMDLIDEEAARIHNVTLFNAPEANKDAVAEHVIGMILCIFNKLKQADSQVRNNIWDREGNRGLELMGKTIGIVGYGNMGSAFAQRLKGFGCEVLYYDVVPKPNHLEYARQTTMDEIFEKAQIFSLHIPLTQHNYKMIDKSYLSKFKNNIHFVNAARGEIVVLQDLIDMIKDGKVLSAALDVLENEKISNLNTTEQNTFNQLIQLPQVLLSPHVAGWSYESYAKINSVLISKIKEFIN